MQINHSDSTFELTSPTPTPQLQGIEGPVADLSPKCAIEWEFKPLLFVNLRSLQEILLELPEEWKFGEGYGNL